MLLDYAGRPTLVFEPEEAQLLTVLVEELITLLDDPDADVAVFERLNPTAYRDDPAAAAEYRELTEASLRSERDDRITACLADLGAVEDIVEVDLGDADTARRWLQVLNDLRLALGTRLGVTQDDVPDIDPDDPAAQPWVVYLWLTALQDAVVQTVLP